MAKDRRKQLKQLQKTRQLKLQQPEGQVKAASEWPVTSCLISNHWQEAGHLIEIMMTRTRDADGLRRQVVGVYLIDLGCLGVKNTFAKAVTSEERQRIVDGMNSGCGGCSEQPVERAAMIIQAAVEYGRSCGFEPNPGFRVSQYMLAGIEPSDDRHLLKFGDGNGKPLYIAGPHDNPKRIRATLQQKFGPDGFHNVMDVGPDELEVITPDMAP